jgi:Clp amino terminal domain, pathogenicity island component
MRNPKQKTAAVLTGAVVLASGAYALGSQADGNAEAAGDRPAFAHYGGGPGPGRAFFGLDRLADRLGVEEDALRDALEDVRGSLPEPRRIRSDFAQELATELGTTKAEVEAALERIREKHEAEFEKRHDAMAEALAKKLNLDVEKVEDALELPRPPFGRPGP